MNIEMPCIYACAHASWVWSLRSRKCLGNFEFKWVQERFLIGQVLGSQEMYRKFCPIIYQEMFLKHWHFLLPETFRKFHILGTFPGLGNSIFLPVPPSMDAGTPTLTAWRNIISLYTMVQWVHSTMQCMTFNVYLECINILFTGLPLSCV